MSSDTENEAKFWARILSSILSSTNSLLGKIGALFPWVRHWLNRPVILPHQRSHWWHMGGTGDQQPAMQIVSYWYVTNRTDQPIRILNAYIKSPRTQGTVFTKDAYSQYHGSYLIPPHTTTDLSADFWIAPPFRKEGQNFSADIVFVDQYGQKRTVKGVEFESDKRKRPKAHQLAQEAIYRLEHDVEKKVAAVLKDEITRYKKYGRRSGQLGSVYATHGGKKITSVYQDSWTSSKSGERQEIVTDPENAAVHSENGDSLAAFFEGLQDEQDKAVFINSLVSRLNRDREYYCVSYLILYVLFRIGQLRMTLDMAKVNLPEKRSFWARVFGRGSRPRLLEPHQRHGFSDFFGLLNGLLRFEHPKFSDQDLDLIEEFIADTDEHTFQIESKIHSARSFRLMQ